MKVAIFLLTLVTGVHAFAQNSVSSNQAEGWPNPPYVLNDGGFDSDSYALDPASIKQFMDAQKNASMSTTQKIMNDECQSQLQGLVQATRNRGSISFSASGDKLAFVKDGKSYVYSDKGLATVDGMSCNFDRSKKLKDGYDAVLASTFPTSKPPADLTSAQKRTAIASFQAHHSVVEACRTQLDSDFVDKLSSDNPLFAAGDRSNSNSGASFNRTVNSTK